MQLHQAGIPEVVLKRAEHPLVLARDNVVEVLPVAARPVIDPTGAGDSFCGAYAACRLLGHSPVDAALRAAATAALVVGCSGVEAALSIRAARIPVTSVADVRFRGNATGPSSV